MERLSLAIIVFIISFPLSASAFHSGGVGFCDGCHASHDTSGVGKQDILIGSDASSTCLRCHESPYPAISDQHMICTADSAMPDGVPPAQMTPGGDFGWLKKDYRWSSETGRGDASYGDRHGHNIVAADFRYRADLTNRTAPGGSYPSDGLYCTSCHDPHGKYRILPDGTEAVSDAPITASGSYGDPVGDNAVGTYRLLGGAGYDCGSNPGYLFSNPAPAAASPFEYNRSEAVTMTRVAYGSGMSEWCANCHPGMLKESYSPGMPGEMHPSGGRVRLGAARAAAYNAYVKSGDLSGSEGSSFWSLVQFETGDGNDPAGRAVMRALAVSDGSRMGGPSSGCNVQCLTCHRAHAAAWDSMMRWNGQGALIVYTGKYPGTDNGVPAWVAEGRTSVETSAGYYGYRASRFAPMQRSLCNKCHTRD